MFSAVLVLFGDRETRCFRQVAALHSDHYKQVPLVGAGCFRQVAAFHSDHYRQVPLVGAGCFRQVAALYSDHYRLFLHRENLMLYSRRLIKLLY